MPQLDFELEEYQERQARVRAAMEDSGIELLLVISPVNINYLIGCKAKGWQVFQVLFFTLEENPLTLLTRLPDMHLAADGSLAEDVRGWGGREPEDPIDIVKQIMDEKGYLKYRIGLEVPQYYITIQEYMKIRQLLGNSLVMEPTNLIQDLKLVRAPAELEYIRKAAKIADAGMQTCIETIAEGKTELEVAAEIHRTIMAMGSDAPASPMNFCAGENSCYSHWAPGERKIAAGDFIHNQFGPSYRQYSTTIGRQLCLGQPTLRMKEIYQVARDAADAAIAEIKAGVPGLRPHEASKKIIADAGMDQYRLHMTGYAVGPAFPPSFVDAVLLDGDSKYTLEEGMVVTVEPPVFIHEEKLGARLIDNVLVTKDGAEVLSKFTRDLIVL